MKRTFVLMALVAMLVLATVVTVSAGFTWCSTDPNVRLPDGGVFHLIVSVPEEYRDAGFVLDVWAPAGSKVVGNTPKIEMTIVLHEGPAGQVSAATVAGFPVSLTGKYRGQDLGTFESMDGTVTAKWVY